MARSTSGYIPHSAVSLESIREVINSDKGHGELPESGGVTAEMIFDKLAQDNNSNLYGAFINGDTPAGGVNIAPATRDIPTDYNSIDLVVPGATDAAKLTEVTHDGVTTGGYDIGDLRGYGGNETITSGGAYPLIYWRNVIDELDKDHIPKNEWVMDFYNTAKIIPEITVYPDLSKIEENVSQSVVNSKYLASSYQSAMFANTALNKSKIASKVGIDYTGDYTGNSPVFSIKVTPKILDGNQNSKYSKTYFNDEGDEIIEFWTIIAVSIGVDPEELILYLKGALEKIIPPGSTPDWFYGPFDPQSWEGSTLKKTWEKLINFLENSDINTYLYEHWPVIVEALTGIAAFIALILVSDIIWDFLEQPADVTDGVYKYANTVAGNYILEDIQDSFYKYQFANKYSLFNAFQKKIDGEGEIIGTYDLNDYNWGEAFSAANLIDNFPNNHRNQLKYLNWDFYPSSIQYDLYTPPPIIGYLIELIPVANCRLHPNKVTAWQIAILPDKYLAPNFTISTGAFYKNIPALYFNTPITFKNAKFCDFVYLTDTANYDRGVDEQLFGVYVNQAINTDGNERALGVGNRIINYTGRDVVAGGSDLFDFATDPDIYYVNYMQEKEPNIVYNPFFRTEKSTDLSDLRAFWEHSSNVNIYRGAAYKQVTGSVGYLYQNLPRLEASTSSTIFGEKIYYIMTLQIDHGGGHIYLNTNGVFKNKLYAFKGQKRSLYEYERYELTEGEADVLYLGDKIELLCNSTGGNYFIILETLSSINNILRFDFSTDFIGSIRTCKLQRLPRYSVSKSSRGCTNAITQYNQTPPLFRWMTGYMGLKTLTLYTDNFANDYFPFTFTVIPEAIDKIEISYLTRKNALLVMDTYTDFSNPEVICNRLLNYDTYDERCSSVLLTFYLSYGVRLPQQISNFTCNSSHLYRMYDTSGVLYNSSIDLSNSNFGKQYSGYILPTAKFSTFRYGLNSLNIDNTFVSDDVANINSIVQSFSANNTPVYGDLGELITIPEILLDSTLISNFAGGQPYYSSALVEPNITWKNSNISVDQLERLLYVLDFSAQENGTLDISGTNPEITDTTALDHIASLISKRWNVIYNAVTIPVITLVGANPLSWNVGETYVEPGATALDGKDGDITADIVIDSNDVDVDVIGSYNVTYNVTDSDGYPAVEVERVVNVVDTIPPVITMLGISPVELTVGDTYVDAGATALDNYDGNITADIVTVNNVNTAVAGTYNVTYNVVDSSDNAATEVTRIVNVAAAYEEVVIGTQTWILKNLDIDDGLGGIYAYGDDEDNVPIYGRLYTWDAAMRVAASIAGWHLPSDAEWTTLTTYLGGTDIAGGKLKETGTTHWNSPNTGATNETGFTALPGGFRLNDGTFDSVGIDGFWWSATEDYAAIAWFRTMTYDTGDVNSYGSYKEVGFSVRLIKD